MALRVGPKGLFGELVAAYVGLCADSLWDCVRPGGWAALVVLERKGCGGLLLQLVSLVR